MELCRATSYACTFRSYPPLDSDIIRPVIPEHPPTPWSGPARRSVWSYSFGFSNREEAKMKRLPFEGSVAACRTGVIDT